MLLKEQKAKFSFLASDEEDEEDKKGEKRRDSHGDRGERRVNRTGEPTAGYQGGDSGAKDHWKKEERDTGKKRGKEAEESKSPTVLNSNTPSSSTYSPHIPPPEEAQSHEGPGALSEDSSQAGSADTRTKTGAHTPPYNGQSQVITIIY